MTQVALSTDFLKAFAAVPKHQQKKVRSFVEKFKADPTQGSIHYEPIYDMADPKVRTVRIGDDYRAVIIHPPQGDVYLCVWVDHHDEAMAWAKHKHFEVNVHTGALQIWESVSASSAPPAATIAMSGSTGLFAAHEDEVLLRLGVPAPLLPAVRALMTEGDLDHLVRYLPAEATDGLYLLAAGYDLATTLAELDKRAPSAVEPRSVDVQDFSAALAAPESKRQFKVIENDAELAGMLDAPLEQWRIFLHPSQLRLVQISARGPTRVLGGAGTGKTVVAMHRARLLAARAGFLQPGERILFTTFTRNLAADVSRSLDLLCTTAERKRIVVAHLHKEAKRIVDTAHGRRDVAPGSDEERWVEFLGRGETHGLPVAFFSDEWQHVVQDQGLTSEADYLRAKRTGRGTSLSRAQRREVWKIFAGYRAALERARQWEWADIVREAGLILSQPSAVKPYRAVVADEVQDFRAPDLRLLRALVAEDTNDIFLVGDGHQRIYGHPASLAAAGINVRGARSRTLRINYRTTQQIRGWAVALLAGISVDDLDEGVDSARGYYSLRTGTPPKVSLFADHASECQHIVAAVQSWLQGGMSPSDICIVARTRALVRAYDAALGDAGIATETIETDGESHDRSKVRLGTMHRVKGLEFRAVVIAGVHRGAVPQRLPKDKFADDVARASFLQGERHLLYVAATRARDELLVTGHGGASEFLPEAASP
jgi:superfamily I DNA/RNA helicase